MDGVPSQPDVSQRPCPGCGLDTAALHRDVISALIRQNAQSWQVVLVSGDQAGAALEHAGQVRDLLRVARSRLTLMLTEDDPTFARWDTELAAAEGGPDPQRLAEDLGFAARKLADAFDVVTGPQWHRAGTTADGARCTVESLARQVLHDAVHRLRAVSTTA